MNKMIKILFYLLIINRFGFCANSEISNEHWTHIWADITFLNLLDIKNEKGEATQVFNTYSVILPKSLIKSVKNGIIKIDTVQITDSSDLIGCLDGIGFSESLGLQLFKPKEKTIEINFSCSDYTVGYILEENEYKKITFTKKTTTILKEYFEFWKKKLETKDNNANAVE